MTKMKAYNEKTTVRIETIVTIVSNTFARRDRFFQTAKSKNKLTKKRITMIETNT